MVFQHIERNIERLVEGLFSRVFRSGLQPVEIGRRLAREMDLRRTVGVSGMVAPNDFIVTIGPQDAERFESFSNALNQELVEALREHARVERYSFMGHVTVDVRVDEKLNPGQFKVSGSVQAQPGGGPLGALVLPDGQRIELADEPVIVGRLPECQVNLSDPNVSRRHAEVRRSGNEFVLFDLGSTNGTRVNGTQISGERRLRDGDEIGVGAIAIRFEGA